MLKQPCYFYNTTGKCRFGRHCKFLHELGTHIQREANLPDRQDEPSVRSKSKSPSESYTTSSFEGEQIRSQDESIKRDTLEKRFLQGSICKFYSTGRFCRFGKRCRFEHVRQPEQVETNPSYNDLKTAQNDQEDQVQDENQNKGEVQQTAESSVEWRNDNVSEFIEKTGDEQQIKSKECRFFKEGNCRFGKRCRFSHIQNESTGTDVALPKQTKSNDDLQKQSQGREPVRPSQIIRVYKRDEISQEKLADLHQTEITQLKRRFPRDRLRVVEEGNGKEAFIFTFCPTDPDWPFDVKSFDIEVDFDEEYPKKLFNLSLPVDQNLPETVRWYIEKSLREWTTKQQKESERNGTVELLFRPFLRWLDKNIEDIVTEGLKQLRRELQAQAAGIQFISAKELKKDVGEQSDQPQEEESSEDDTVEDGGTAEPEIVVYKKSEKIPDDQTEVLDKRDVDYVGKSSDESATTDEDDDDDDDGDGKISSDKTAEHKRPQINPDTERRGTEMSFRNMGIWYCTTLLMEKLHLVVQCERCKATTDFMTPPNRANSLECGKCNSQMMVAFRAVLVHSYSSTFGYLDLEGCKAFDVVLQDCHFSLGCIVCSRDILVKKMTPGKVMELRCRGCHNKMTFATDSVKLTVLDTTGGVDTSLYSGNVHKVNVKKQRRVLKDPAIQEGKPLPDNGACKHYKKSFRWLRFPCCGKTYPCDICHDDKEDHEMVRANRMICGFCCREQPFAAERPCVGCSSALTKVRTSHWEGGKGCRDKTAMSRGDNRKYTNQNKTVSSKAQALKDKSKGKKTTAKLSTAKTAQK